MPMALTLNIELLHIDVVFRCPYMFGHVLFLISKLSLNRP